MGKSGEFYGAKKKENKVEKEEKKGVVHKKKMSELKKTMNNRMKL